MEDDDSENIPQEADAGTAAEIDEVLRDFGIRYADGKAREELSARLFDEGMTPADARFLGNRIDEGSQSVDETARRFGAVLASQERWTASVFDLRHAETKRQERMEAREAAQAAEDAPGSTHYPNIYEYAETEAAAVHGLTVAEMRRRKWCQFVWTKLQEGTSAEDLAAANRATPQEILDDAKEWEETGDGTPHGETG